MLSLQNACQTVRAYKSNLNKTREIKYVASKTWVLEMKYSKAVYFIKKTAAIQ
jgi:hypothetical protein